MLIELTKSKISTIMKEQETVAKSARTRGENPMTSKPGQAAIDIDALIAGIARDHFPQLRERGFARLEAKNSDQLDFLDTAVWAIRSALEEAYTCGFADAERAHGHADF